MYPKIKKNSFNNVNSSLEILKNPRKGFIKQDFIEKIKERSDIVEIVNTVSELKKKGKYFFCLSPFTEEKTPSFCVNPVAQRFTDYSSGKYGDAITFVMEYYKLTYPEAVEWMAQHYGEIVEYEDSETARQKKVKFNRIESLRPVLHIALKNYQEELQKLDKNHPAWIELREKRGYDDIAIKDYGIGYAPGEKFLFNIIKELGKYPEAKELGLITDKADKYWDRVIYPIHDKNGLLVGFAGRDVSNKPNNAKWINPQDSILYQKDKIWYCLDRPVKPYKKTMRHGLLKAITMPLPGTGSNLIIQLPAVALLLLIIKSNY